MELYIVYWNEIWNVWQVKGLPVIYAALQPKSALADAAAAAGMEGEEGEDGTGRGRGRMSEGRR